MVYDFVETMGRPADASSLQASLTSEALTGMELLTRQSRAAQAAGTMLDSSFGQFTITNNPFESQPIPSPGGSIGSGEPLERPITTPFADLQYAADVAGALAAEAQLSQLPDRQVAQTLRVAERVQREAQRALTELQRLQQRDLVRILGAMHRSVRGGRHGN